MSPKIIREFEIFICDWWLGLGKVTRWLIRILLCATASLLAEFVHTRSEGILFMAKLTWDEFEKLNRTMLTLSFIFFFIVSIMLTRMARDWKKIREANKELCEAYIKSSEINEELQRVNKKIKEDSNEDILTGLKNRKFLEETRKSIESRAIRNRKKEFPCVAAIDLNKLKFINDTLGHFYGDMAIKMVADIIKKSIRADDIPIHISGDEFFVIWFSDSLEDFQAMGGKLENALQNVTGYIMDDKIHDITISCSVGYSGMCALKEGFLENLFEIADALMYNNKKRRYDSEN